MKAERNDILLTEYETCQSHNNAIGNQSWISISIIWSGNIILWAGVAYNIILKGSSLEPPFAFLVLSLGIIMFLFLLVVYKWQNRVSFLTFVNNERMRRIEDEVSLDGSIIMEKNWLIYGSDLKDEYDRKKSNRWCKLSEQRKENINNICLRYPLFPRYVRPTGHYFMNAVFTLVILSWLGLTIWAFILSSSNG